MGVGKIDWELGRRLYLRGESPLEISKAISCDKSTVCRRVKRDGWQRAGEVLQGVASGGVALRESVPEDGGGGELLAGSIKERLQADVSAAVGALESIPPADLALHQLAVRERVAGDVTKRAASLFDIGEREQAVVNIAVLSQLPDKVAEGLH